MKTVAIIQARLGSSRLPEKALVDIAGQSMLARTVARVRRARGLDAVAVATTVRLQDDRIAEAARRLGVSYIRGSEADVLDRYAQAARELEAEVVVRITSDCPLHDPEVIDRGIQAFQQSEPPVDYASNTLERTYPRGLDTEVFSVDALERAWHNAVQPHQREHVTPYFYEHPEKFRLLSFTGEADYSALRWTVDTPEDLEFVRQVYAHFDSRDDFSWRDVLSLLERKPSLAETNRCVRQKVLTAGA